MTRAENPNTPTLTVVTLAVTELGIPVPDMWTETNI